MPAGIVGSQCAEFKKRLVRAAECRMRRRLQKREVLKFQPEAAQLQDHVREIAPPDFRFRKLVALLEILGRIEADAHAGLHAPRTPCTLPRRRFRDVLDRQSLDTRLRVVPRNAGRTRIHHVGDSRNRERCFRDVRREHHAGLFRMPKNATLFIGTHAPVKRQDVEGRGVQFMCEFARQILDVAFRRQKTKQVVAVARFQIENRIAGLVQKAGIALAANVANNTTLSSLVSRLSSKKVFHIHRERAALGLHHAAVIVEFLKQLRIKCRGGHNQLKFRAGLQNRLENAE